MAREYRKLFTRDNSMLSFNLYLEAEAPFTNNYFLRSKDGVTSVYYPATDLELFKKDVLKRAKSGQLPKPPQNFWKGSLTPVSKNGLIDFYGKFVNAWQPLSYYYFVPKIDNVPAKVLRSAIEVRNKTSDFWDTADNIFIRSLRTIFPSLGALSKFISIDELVGGTVPSKRTLKRRAKGFYYYNGKFKDTKPANVKVVVQKGNRKILKGAAAFPGVVTGKVRIVFKKSDIGKVQKGEILVAPMTTPDYLPAIKKAAAIVTDEGGVTSHAAIVSRELEKPTIIGTRNASVVLRTGDIVVVDANRGSVRKL